MNVILQSSLAPAERRIALGLWKNIFLKHGLGVGCVAVFSQVVFFRLFFFFSLAGEMWITNGEGI